jgi:hypothetical protein
MVLDLVALDKTIKKLQLIRQLASDPDVAHLLNNDGKGSDDLATQQVPKAPAERRGVRHDVLKYVGAAADVSCYRTARQITEMMEADRYKFESKQQYHATTVRESLRELEREGLVQKAGTSSEDGAATWRRTP